MGVKNTMDPEVTVSEMIKSQIAVSKSTTSHMFQLFKVFDKTPKVGIPFFKILLEYSGSAVLC